MLPTVKRGESRRSRAYVVADFEDLDLGSAALLVVLLPLMALPRAPLRREFRVHDAVDVEGSSATSIRSGVPVLGLLPFGEPRLALPASAARHTRSA
jgi:hypothetical protein